MATVGIFFFFIIPECVYSPMSVNSICISVNGRNFHQEMSAGTRENLSNLLRSKEVAAGFPLLCPFSPAPAKKKKKRSCFISQRLSHHPPVPAQLRASGHPWHVVLPARYKLCSGHVPCLFTSPLSSANRWNKPLTYGRYPERRHIASSLSRSAAAFFPSLNSTWYPSATRSQAGRQDLTPKAVNVPLRAGEGIIGCEGSI